jgi:hypothetical protein
MLVELKPKNPYGHFRLRAKGVMVWSVKLDFSSQDKDIFSLMISLGGQFKKTLVE